MVTIHYSYKKYRITWLITFLLGVVVILLSSPIIRNFRRPLSDGTDTDNYEFIGYYLSKNITFWPWPHLQLITKQSFYPYGSSQAFACWGLERDYWYALCYRLFGGPGPYLQPYYVFSLVVAATGTFLLLQSRFGLLRSLVAGLTVSVFNFYALFKFPVHMSICVVHWMTLCIIATYCLLHDLLNRQPILLAYWLLLVWLHIQLISQELGYVAGYALTFSVLSFPVVAYLLIRQFPQPGYWLKYTGQYIRTQYANYPVRINCLLVLILISGWLFIPPVLQIAGAVLKLDFSALPQPRDWSHPARLLIPYIPGIITYPGNYLDYLHDTFESFGQGSPGLYLILMAGVGLWQNRRRTLLWLPVVMTIILCLAYHPVAFPTLKLFPWFAFNRAGGRATLAYPVLFILLALPIRWPHQKGLQGLGVALILLMGVEWYTGYSSRLSSPPIVATDDFLAYCDIVKRQPGEAVLDWPFCVIGANGVGYKEGLCPYYKEQNATFAYRRFYDKSTVGQYYPRLHPSQIQPFLRDKWPRLLTPGRSFTDADWTFMDHFLLRNKFAGINLYPDLLTRAQTNEFIKRYGQPIAKTQFPMAGQVLFIPLNPQSILHDY